VLLFPLLAFQVVAFPIAAVKLPTPSWAVELGGLQHRLDSRTRHKRLFTLSSTSDFKMAESGQQAVSVPRKLWYVPSLNRRSHSFCRFHALYGNQNGHDQDNLDVPLYNTCAHRHTGNTPTRSPPPCTASCRTSTANTTSSSRYPPPFSLVYIHTYT
jgi:hypothetical protein